MTDEATDFVESFAAALAQSGMQRMAARVLAALLAAPDGGMTAGALAESLGVSAGAISGATTYLSRTGLVDRSRPAGKRADRFSLQGTTWAEATLVETQSLALLAARLEDGITEVTDPAAVHRLIQTRDFFVFLQTELPALVQRWREESETA